MEPETRLGKYRVIRLLATGGMGEVFLARQEGPAGFSKTVVLKKILRHLAHDQGFVEMFLNEARMAALLTHPNVVQIFELAQEDDTWFIVMEYVHGRSLRSIKQRLLDRGEVLSSNLAARVCSQALQALHYAHNLTDEQNKKLGIVHRDISPDNVLVSFAGVVKLVDFGIAKAANTATITQSGTLKGKFAYMAPEQIDGGAVDARTDIYAMGVLLYELVTGIRPFSDGPGTDFMNEVRHTPAVPPRNRNPAVPVGMSDLILKALSKDPADRFASAEDMANALEGLVAATGETLTSSHVSAFLKGLFGAEAATFSSTAVPVVEEPSRPGGRRTQQMARGTMALSPPPTRGSSKLESPDTGASQVVDRKALAATMIEDVPLGGAEDGDTIRVERGATELSNLRALFRRAQATEALQRALAWIGPRWWLITATAAVTLLVALVSWAVWPLDPPDASPAAASAGRTEQPVDPAPHLSEARPSEVSPAVASAAVADAGSTVPPAPRDAQAEAPGQVAQDAAPKRLEGPPRAAVAVGRKNGPESPSRKAVTVAAVRSVKAVATKPKKAAPARGKVMVRVNPWAEVFHEGKSLGITPMEPVEVPSGAVSLTLRNAELGVVRKYTVNVPPGGQVVLKADLFDKP